MINCRLFLSEVPLHLYQVIAGFEALGRAGTLNLTIIPLKPDDKRRLPYNMLEAETEDKLYIFDMNDGYDNLPECKNGYVQFYNGLLDRCDVLVKRSFNTDMNRVLKSPEKIKATAPNYWVTAPESAAHDPVPCDPSKEKLKKVVRKIPGTACYNGHVFEKNFKALPVCSPEPKVLFMTRLWNPAGDFKGQLTNEKSEERSLINETRAACIRLCRKEFGSRFFGGVIPADFSKSSYPDIVLETPQTGRKDKYLDHMKRFDIHIATSGLHRSTGWKFAEYIAASKAIVTEPLFYSSIGDLSENVNYLTFNNVTECVEKVAELFDNQKRSRMMQANYQYFNEYMRCEKMIARALELI